MPKDRSRGKTRTALPFVYFSVHCRKWAATTNDKRKERSIPKKDVSAPFILTTTIRRKKKKEKFGRFSAQTLENKSDLFQEAIPSIYSAD